LDVGVIKKTETEKPKNRIKKAVNQIKFSEKFGSINRTDNFFRFMVHFRLMGLKNSINHG